MMLGLRRRAAAVALCALWTFPIAHAADLVRLLPKGAVVSVSGGELQLTLVRRNVLRVHFLPGGRASAPALVMSPRAPTAARGPVSIRRRGDELQLESGVLRVTFDTRTDALALYRAGAAQPILRQADLASLAQRTFALQFAARDAPLYGVHGFNAFQPARSGLLRHGRQLATAGEQGDAGAPLVWSTAGFALLLDSQKTLFDLTSGRIQVLHQTRADPDYYLILGTPAQIFAALDDLTGHAPLFPKWSFGFINSQWGINERELLHIVRRYRRLHIPLDAFSLDFDWKAWGQNHYGEFRWNTKKFPDAPSGKLDRELTALGVHLIGIMKPRIHVNTVEGQYATAHHLWIPGEKASLDYFSHKPVKTLDFDKAATRTWFFNPALRQSFRTGIVGWWNDEADETGDDTQFFNMQRALYDGQRKYFKQRVWSLNRNFWLGAQRYAYGLWSGDIRSGFASLAAQRPRMLRAIDVG
ncbi:MAG: glycoside hydrolase family 31, partial [Pseudomonadota bacterium]|nr:glycoside hydrolase family 31 [Pseudomonadota bacterium]